MWVGVTAGVAALGLRLTGRQWEDKEEEEKNESGRGEKRHGGVCFPQQAGGRRWGGRWERVVHLDHLHREKRDKNRKRKSFLKHSQDQTV